MNKQDLTEYSDRELSLHVYNDEALYRNRRMRNFREYLEEVFIFTDEQWDELKKDLEEEEE